MSAADEDHMKKEKNLHLRQKRSSPRVMLQFVMGFARMSEILVEPRGFDSTRHVQTDSLEISGSNAEPTSRLFYLWDVFLLFCSFTGARVKTI